MLKLELITITRISHLDSLSPVPELSFLVYGAGRKARFEWEAEENSEMVCWFYGCGMCSKSYTILYMGLIVVIAFIYLFNH